VAGSTLLMDLDQHSVAIAVQPHLADPLPVTTGLTLDPVLTPTAGEERGAAGRQGLVQGQVVHPSHHQDLSGAVVLDDGRDQSGRIALEQCGDIRVKRAAGDGLSWVGHAPIVPTPFPTELQPSDLWCMSRLAESRVVHQARRNATCRGHLAVRLRWSLVTFARSERAELCDLLDEVGSHAPTLCDGWETHDLAAHLWVRETDPIGASGIVAKPLSNLYERRIAEIKQRWEFSELVDRVRRGPARFSIFAIPGVDEGANTTEFFIHHEDVRRAGDSPQTSRQLGDDVEEWMWRRLKLLGRAWFRRVQVGVVLERLGSADEDGAPETIRAVSGASTVTLVGTPSELMLYAHGRTSVAEIKLVGEPEAIAILNASDLRT
jgi:uncharacterized protein (TIGR03085 family)